MRFLDIAVASAYAVACLSLILVMSPVAPHAAAVDASAKAALDTAISSYVEEVGLPFLAASPPSAICASAAEASNSTLQLGVSVDGVTCGSSPPQGALAVSSLRMKLPGRTVVIEAWLERR